MRKLFLVNLFSLMVLGLAAQCNMRTITELPKKLDETSALVYFDGLFWTINDSGNSNHIYAFDTIGNIVRTIEIAGAKNVDWEALAIDGENLYIGDFGNNFNSRSDLTIYVVKRTELIDNKVKPHIEIHFEYPDQLSKTKSIRKTKFDCEAMVVIDGKICLFTKDWASFSGALYRLDIAPGNQIAERVGDLNADGLITGATIHENCLYLIGYHNYVPVLWEFNRDDILQYKKRYELPQMLKYQTEGIAVLDHQIYITCEKSEVKQSLFVIACPLK